MKKGFVEDLEWRGLVHGSTPGVGEQFDKESTAAYIGFDPTADSLHVGSLVQILLLCRLQQFGHQPVVLVGGATGMIGDPSGKSQERNLLNEEILQKNISGIQAQLAQFIDFETDQQNKAILVNNYDWMKKLSFIDFARDIGKHISVNYMMAKESVKKRLSSESKEGMSFTEFTYQLIQGYDFLHLYQNNNCKVQLGGSDQWGNITTGTELVRRKAQGSAYALVSPLVTKADGGKFGKTEQGNVWLDPERTSPYSFYQFWINTSDEDAEKYIKIFTFLEKEEIEKLITEHQEAPHLRILQKKLGEELTLFVHGKQELDNALKATNMLFGKSTSEDLKSLDEKTFLAVFEGVGTASVSKNIIQEELNIVDVLVAHSGFLKSNGEARRDLKGNAISVNKEKVTDSWTLKESDLIQDKYLLLQKGKKNYFILQFA